MTAETWTLPARAEAPAAARRLTRDYAARSGASAEELPAIALCVSEAVTNAVMHAYPDVARRGDIEVEMRKPDGYLCLYVRDTGAGMRPRVNSPGLGLGLPLMSQGAASIEVRDGERGGTEVIMRFDISGSAT